jgi:hypothetical protein
MAMAALSPNSVLASPVQVNPQVKTDLQSTLPQADQDGQKAVKKAQTDTVTISAQALKMADDKNADSKEVNNKTNQRKDLQLASDKADAALKSALQAYTNVGADK